MQSQLRNRLRRSIENFAILLRENWEVLSRIAVDDDTGSFIADWCQSNWELVVEGSLGPNVALEVYGDGADCNPQSSRVLFPEKLPTHRILCFVESGTTVFDFSSKTYVGAPESGFVFDRIGSIDDEWFYEKPPFDKVQCTFSNIEYWLDLGLVRFELSAI